jgi:hypothetical protein
VGGDAAAQSLGLKKRDIDDIYRDCEVIAEAANIQIGEGFDLSTFVARTAPTAPTQAPRRCSRYGLD